MLGMIALDSSFGRGISEYSASKGAVINFTRQRANEWAQYGITVNTLSPGFFASEQSPVGQGWFADFINTWCPMKRNGSDHELDAAIIFMTCEENSYMTGNNVVIDGGWTLHLSFLFADSNHFQNRSCCGDFHSRICFHFAASASIQSQRAISLRKNAKRD